MLNKFQVNGVAMGSGTPVTRIQLVMELLLTSSGSIAITARRYLTSAITAQATTASFVAGGVIRLESAITAAASGVISTTNYIAKYLSSAITALASPIISLRARRSLESAITGTATHETALSRGIQLSGSTTASASAVASAVEVFMRASEDRTMRLASEDRKMKVF